MSLKTVVAMSICATLLLGASAAHADAYRPGEFLLLDLDHAALSPKPLGPATQFEPVAIQAKTDAARDTVRVVPVAKIARAPAVKPRIAAYRPAPRPRGNPLDANAADTRVQVWPCRSGGICNWQR